MKRADARCQSVSSLLCRDLGMVDYLPTWQKMLEFTRDRDEDTADEFWLLEHYPVFTLGQAGKEAHVLNRGDISLIKADRGGQVTYHGPGQLVIYFLIDLARRELGTRQLVESVEHCVISLLEDFKLTAVARRDAPGVYLNNEKIASLGFRIKKSRCYHGLALNVSCDLEPFTRINPCGYAGMTVTRLADHCQCSFDEVKLKMVRKILACFENS